jgi:hydrogenase maturation protease
MRVLVGGVGYRCLRDESVGPWAAEQLAPRAGGDVEVEDLGYHPVGFVQNLQDREPYDRLVLVGAVRRGRPEGTVDVYRWDRVIGDVEAVQERVAEAVTGVISLDGLMIVGAALGGEAMPADVRVVEIEPGPEGWGEEFSAAITERLGDVLEAAWTLTRP